MQAAQKGTKRVKGAEISVLSFLVIYRAFFNSLP
jgi:hypothetical protein